MADQSKSARFTQQPVIGVKRKLWRQDDPEGHLADAQFKDVREKVLTRDNYTCCFCQFRSDQWQEVHHLDDDHHNNDHANLVTVCTPCHAVFHIGLAAVQQTAFMAVLPELAQTEINSLCRAIFVVERIHRRKKDVFVSATEKKSAPQALRAMSTELEISNNVCNRLNGLYALFRYRGQDTLKAVPIHDDAPTVDCSALTPWAMSISALTDELFSRRKDLVEPLRIVPTRTMFKDAQLEYYATKMSAPFDYKSWEALYQQLFEVAA